MAPDTTLAFVLVKRLVQLLLSIMLYHQGGLNRGIVDYPCT
jgi:hypothetical protein